MSINPVLPGPSVPTALTDVVARVQAYAKSQGQTWYLVGGLLRDQVMGRPPAYLNADVALPAQAIGSARALAAHLGGAFVLLDEAEGSARVVVACGPQRLELDLSDFRAPTLAEDLARRDFTVNAMAISLQDWLASPERLAGLIDPLDGRRALQERRLSACFPGTFERDPVRILRAFRFAAQLEMTLDPAMSPLMAQALPKLGRVSGERVRDELLAIFETDRAHPAIQAFDALGGLDALFPELSLGRDIHQGGFHHLDVLGHEIETIAQSDRFLADFAEFSEPLRAPLAAYCRTQLVERRSRKSLIKLAGLFHDVGKPSKRTVEPDGEIWFLGHEHAGAELIVGVLERLRLSNRESEMVRLLVLHHLRPGFLSREPQLTRRAVYRFYKDLGDDGPACLLTWWADRMATRGPKSRVDQIDQQRARLEEMLTPYFFDVEEVVKPRRLVGGHELMAALKLSPGPAVGALLSAIEEAQAEGRIRTSEEALAFARAQWQQHAGS